MVLDVSALIEVAIVANGRKRIRWSSRGQVIMITFYCLLCVWRDGWCIVSFSFVATIDFVCEPEAEEVLVKSSHPVRQAGGSCFLSWPCEIFLLLYHEVSFTPISKKVHGRGCSQKSLEWITLRAQSSQLHLELSS
jgi:hypothetical protein